jgi:hypothetical protein
MNRREAERLTRQNDHLRSLGFTTDECDQLRRISRTLSNWAERCCNEDIETRDDGSAWLTNRDMMGAPCKPYRIANREAGALRRLEAILKPHARRLTYYHQTDPRGVALYLVERKRLRPVLAEYKTRQPTWDEYTVLNSTYNQVGFPVY